MRSLLAAALATLISLPALAAEPAALVICAPGYPGSTKEAQPTIDALVGVMAKQAKGWEPKELTGAYYETENGGVARLSQPDAALTLVPLAFFLEHEQALKLTARQGAAFKGRDGTEVWSLFAKKGSVTKAADLDGWTIVSTVAFSPRFIRGPVLGSWGKLPETVKFQQTNRFLSPMRKAAGGEKIAFLLDSETATQIMGTEMAKDFEPLHKSAPLPMAIVATVDGRLPEARWKPMGEALLKLGETPDGAKTLEAVWKLKFLKLDDKALAAARKSFAEAK